MILYPVQINPKFRQNFDKISPKFRRLSEISTFAKLEIGAPATKLAAWCADFKNVQVGANTVWYSSKFPLLYSLYVRSYTGTALGPQSGVLVAPFNIRGAKPKFPGRMQNFKTLLLARVRVLRRKSFRSQKGSTAGLKTHGDQGQNAKGRF